MFLHQVFAKNIICIYLATEIFQQANFFIFNNIILNFTMKSLIAKINEELAAFQVNAEAQAVKGNKAAGARARKAALELMKDLKEFRKASVEASK